jgi:hypothetical protein
MPRKKSLQSKSLFSEMMEDKKDFDEAVKKYPSACRLCFGISVDEDGFPCKSCLRSNKCPVCAEVIFINVQKFFEEKNKKLQCSKCKWKYGNPPVLPIGSLIESEDEESNENDEEE